MRFRDALFWNAILVYWLSEWPKNPLSHRRRGYGGIGRLYPGLTVSWTHIFYPVIILPGRPRKQFRWKTIWKKSRGRTRQLIGSEKRVRPCSKNVMIDADSLRQRNSKIQRSYDKMLIEWVRSGRICASWWEPNIFPSGPPTQSVSIYISFTKVNVLAPVVQTLDSAIQLISIRKTSCVIHSIDFYLVDNAIQRLNNRGQEKNYYDPGFLSWGMLNYIPRVGITKVVETFVIGALR